MTPLPQTPSCSLTVSYEKFVIYAAAFGMLIYQ